MSARRASTLQTERKSLGDPFKVYSEITNAGKNIQGTKKHVRWLFGFSEAPGEYEVKLVHSLVSGKKTVWENGIEIVTSSSVLASDFSHGWSSRDTGRLYRVEVNLGMEAEYVFAIDGMRFDDLPIKRVSSKKLEAVDHNNSRYGGTVTDLPSSSASRRISGSTTQPVSARVVSDSSRSSFQSPAERTKPTPITSEFDPFAAGVEPFDPFGNNSIPKPSPTSQPKLHSPLKASTTPSSTSTTPTRTTTNNNNNNNNNNNKSSKPTATASIFGMMEDIPPAAVADPFATKTSSVSSFDAFGGSGGGSGGGGASDGYGFAPTTIPQTMTGASRASSNSNFEWGSTTSSVAPSSSFDMFNTPADFPTTHSTTTTTTTTGADPFATTAHNHTTASVNPFDLPSTSTTTTTTSTSVSSVSGYPKASRRASAAEIVLDFTGLTMAPETPKMSAPRDIPPPPPVPQPSLPETVVVGKEEEAVIDPWASTLVDLDLSGKTAQRRSSQFAAPSLNNLMGPSGGVGGVGGGGATRRASRTIHPQEVLNSLNDPFGAPAGVLVATTSHTAAHTVGTVGTGTGTGAVVAGGNHPFHASIASHAISSIGTPMMPPPSMSSMGYASGYGGGIPPAGYGNPNGTGGMNTGMNHGYAAPNSMSSMNSGMNSMGGGSGMSMNGMGMSGPGNGMNGGAGAGRSSMIMMQPNGYANSANGIGNGANGYANGSIGNGMGNGMSMQGGIPIPTNSRASFIATMPTTNTTSITNTNTNTNSNHPHPPAAALPTHHHQHQHQPKTSLDSLEWRV